ncbi:MAG: glycosidase [Candidatus Bathyarchaeota archaeon]|nr:glycosidase [Candidatus Bathyarchaeota archaeon]
MKRFEHNPILKPIKENAWESEAVFNAAAVYSNGLVHLLYRAIGNDHVSRIGYATSTDGCTIKERFDVPVFNPVNHAERDGCEDPRLTIIGDECLMAYTAFRNHDYPIIFQISLTSISMNDFLNRKWDWKERILPFPGIRNKDAVILPGKVDGKYVMFHRIEPSICVAYSEDLKKWHGFKSIMEPRDKMWDSLKIGAAGTPIELNEGYLFIYHGVDEAKRYSLGAALLDKSNPEKVLYRSDKPILTPCEGYECVGTVPNVVFSCGNVQLDDKVIVYYGGADSVLCGAIYELNELLPRK